MQTSADQINNGFASRYSLVEEVCHAHGRRVMDAAVAKAVKRTSRIPLQEFARSCKMLEYRDQYPSNLGNAIWADYRSRTATDKDTLTDYPELSPAEKALSIRYCKLMQSTILFLGSNTTPTYTEFWHKLNSEWLSASDVESKVKAVSRYEAWVFKALPDAYKSMVAKIYDNPSSDILEPESRKK